MKHRLYYVFLLTFILSNSAFSSSLKRQLMRGALYSNLILITPTESALSGYGKVGVAAASLTAGAFTFGISTPSLLNSFCYLENCTPGYGDVYVNPGYPECDNETAVTDPWQGAATIFTWEYSGALGSQSNHCRQKIQYLAEGEKCTPRSDWKEFVAFNSPWLFVTKGGPGGACVLPENHSYYPCLQIHYNLEYDTEIEVYNGGLNLPLGRPTCFTYSYVIAGSFSIITGLLAATTAYFRCSSPSTRSTMTKNLLPSIADKSRNPS